MACLSSARKFKPEGHAIFEKHRATSEGTFWKDACCRAYRRCLSVPIASSPFCNAVADFGQKCVESDCARRADIVGRLAANASTLHGLFCSRPHLLLQPRE